MTDCRTPCSTDGCRNPIFAHGKCLQCCDPRTPDPAYDRELIQDMVDGMKSAPLFENWCSRGKMNEHESAGKIHYGHGVRFLFVRPGDTDDIELHLCKHCGCVFGIVKERK